jgi:hypothetical protein
MKYKNIITLSILAGILLGFLYLTTIPTTKTWAQSPQTNELLNDKNFTIKYDFTDLAACSPSCIDRTITYDSDTNELTIINNTSPKEVVTIRHLTDKEENMLSDAISPLMIRGNLTAHGICELGTIYCVSERLSIVLDGEEHISSTSHITPLIIEERGYTLNLLNNLALNNQTKS